jgi:cytochrome c biogenesis protein CcdA
MAWVASTGNVLEGLVVGLVFGLGISLPVIGVAYMLHRGVEITAVGRAVWSKVALVRSLSGGAMIMFGVFTLVFWAILLQF